MIEMIQLLRGVTPVWSLRLNAETEAGLALALYVILSQQETSFTSNFTIKLNGIDYTIENGQVPSDFIPEYLEYFNVNKDFSLPILDQGTKKLFLSVYSGQGYNIYKFDSPKFIQGFIAGFDYFEEDFRKYIHKLPYTLDERGNKNFYMISGYDIGAY